MSYSFLADKLARGETIIIDGGTGTDIQRRGAPMSGDTWCADVNATHLGIVEEVHRDYVKAGADVIAANTFASSALSFNYYKRDDDVLRLDALAVKAAKAATAGTPVAVAGSVSTMRPVYPGTDRTNLDFNWSEADAKKLFRRKIGNLKACGVDLIMMEMMRDADLSLWACQEAMASGLPVWIGIAVERREDGEISGFGRSDSLLKDFAPRLAALKPDLISIMHTSPEDTAAALEIVRQSWHGPLGAYPESGYFKSPDWVFTEITPQDFVAIARTWREAGVSALGGCCGIGPEHIALLAKEMRT
ncbi:MAG: homocysteine S-methyltransferase family protein [Hyphomicrobiales bacterium]